MNATQIEKITEKQEGAPCSLLEFLFDQSGKGPIKPKADDPSKPDSGNRKPRARIMCICDEDDLTITSTSESDAAAVVQRVTQMDVTTNLAHLVILCDTLPCLMV